MKLWKKIVLKLRLLVTKPILDFIYKPRGISEIKASEIVDSQVDFKNTITVGVNSTSNIYIINNGRIYTDCNTFIAVFDSRNNMISGASWQYANKQYVEPQYSNIFREGVKFPPQIYDATILSLLTGGGGNYNYFHWLFDALPRLHILRQSQIYEKVDYFFVPDISYKFQLETLNCLGINQENSISSKQIPHIKSSKIIVTDHPRPNSQEYEIPQWICEFLRSSFLELKTPISLKSDKIYITRKDSNNKRRILNEAELIDILLKEGFAIFALTEYSFLQQISIFANARTVISPHGAGLANLVFCEPGTNVIELFNESYQINLYENLSKRLGLKYYKYVGTSNASSKTNAQNTDIQINISEFTKLIKNF